MVESYLWSTLWIFIIRSIVRLLFKIRLEVLIGTLFYGTFLVIKRGLAGLVSKFKRWRSGRQAQVIVRPAVPEKVTQINSVYRLSGLEVVLGLDSNHKPIRYDLDEYHTLLAGNTGFGKTNILNSIIAQLVGRGSSFLDYYDLYLFDLKSDEKDHLSKWAPVITGYFPLDEDASTMYAVQQLENLVRTLNQRKKKVVVIIDELAAMTEMVPTHDRLAKQAGKEMIRQAAAKLRAYGALIAATQRPHFEVVDRQITSQLDGKICLHTDDLETAKMILRTTSKPKWDTRTFQRGEFIIRTPRYEKRGRSLLMTVPAEIDATVFNIIEARSQGDIRMKLLASVAGNLDKGANVPGINTVAPNFEGLHSKDIEAYYRNFVNAGVFANKKGTAGRVLAVEYPMAQAALVQYIKDGRWEEDPPATRK